MNSNTKISLENILPHYIKLQEASDKTGLSYYQLREMVLQGKVAYIKSGVKFLVNEQALCDYLSQMEQRDGAENDR